MVLLGLILWIIVYFLICGGESIKDHNKMVDYSANLKYTKIADDYKETCDFVARASELYDEYLSEESKDVAAEVNQTLGVSKQQGDFYKPWYNVKVSSKDDSSFLNISKTKYLFELAYWKKDRLEKEHETESLFRMVMPPDAYTEFDQEIYNSFLKQQKSHNDTVDSMRARYNKKW